MPNWWTACYGGRAPADGEIWPGNYPLDRQRVLHRLPHEAAALLRDKHTTTVPITWNHDTGEHGESTQFCTVVSATDRQVIINALGDPISAATQERVPLGRIDGYPAELGFGPLLPTGKGVCFCA